RDRDEPVVPHELAHPPRVRLHHQVGLGLAAHLAHGVDDQLEPFLPRLVVDRLRGVALFCIGHSAHRSMGVPPMPLTGPWAGRPCYESTATTLRAGTRAKVSRSTPPLRWPRRLRERQRPAVRSSRTTA